MIIPFSKVQHLLQEGDVLLFRMPPFPKIGWWVAQYTGGKHSHVGLAHYDSEWFVIEQKEFKGGRQVPLTSQLHDEVIDVYRASPSITIPVYQNNDIVWNTKFFTKDMANKVIETASIMIGDKYGWQNIWNIAKGYAPFFRLLRRHKNGDDTLSKVYVCSTLVTYSYRINYFDPCPNLADNRTTPADLARSSLFHYLFTIGL